MVFFFQPANITSQILNFGLPAPIDLQVVGRNAEATTRSRSSSRRGSRGFRAPPTCTSTRWWSSREIRSERRPHEGRPARADPARRHQQHADFAQRQRHRSRRTSG